MNSVPLSLSLRDSNFLFSKGFCGSKLSLIASVVFTAGMAAKDACRNAVVKHGEGHRSVVTAGDISSQKEIIDACLEIRGVKFLCEESSNDPRVLNNRFPTPIFTGITLVVDPIDGTARFSGKYPDWSVGVGAMEDGGIVGGAIGAPAANGGMLLFSQIGCGAFLYEGGSLSIISQQKADVPAERSIVLFGVDASLYPNLTKTMSKIAANVRAKYDVGSGLFGLMMVALGRAQVVVQTPQKAWDWVPAYRALREAGKVFHFFRLKGGSLMPVENYDFEAFCSDPEQRLGFVAGEPKLAQKIFDLLPNIGWARIRPESVLSNW